MLELTDLLYAADHGAPIALPDTAAERRAVRVRAEIPLSDVAAAIGCALRSLWTWETTDTVPRDRHQRLRYRRVLGLLQSAAEAQLQAA
jgi:hypothetical protein